MDISLSESKGGKKDLSILEMELLPEDTHAVAISTSQLLDCAKPGVDIVIERHPSPTGVSCNFLVTIIIIIIIHSGIASFFDALGKNYTDGA